MSQAPEKLRVTKPVVLQVEPTAAAATRLQRQEQNLDRVRSQAERRVRLGVELLQAAQAHADHQQKLIDQFHDQQKQMRDQVHQDIAKSLQTYDQWMAQFDQRFSAKLQKLETRVDALQHKWAVTERQISAVVGRAQILLDQVHQCQRASADRSAEPRPTESPSTSGAATVLSPPPSTPDTSGPNGQDRIDTTTQSAKRPRVRRRPPPSPARATADASNPGQTRPSQKVPVEQPVIQEPDGVYRKALDQLLKNPPPPNES